MKGLFRSALMVLVAGFCVPMLSAVQAAGEAPGIATDIRNLERARAENQHAIEGAYVAIESIRRLAEADEIYIGFSGSPNWFAPVVIPVTEEELRAILSVELIHEAWGGPLERPLEEMVAERVREHRRYSALVREGFAGRISQLESFIARARRSNAQIDNEIADLRAGQVRTADPAVDWSGTWVCTGANRMTLSIGGTERPSSMTAVHHDVAFGPTASETYQVDQVKGASASGRYLYKNKSPAIGPPRKNAQGQPLSDHGRAGEWPGRWEASVSGDTLTIRRYDDASPWEGGYTCKRTR
ncbi:hypothetical protein [Lentisalinibacter sediminis]|uniref:hypothetical protein n=1 Tax=Lentisalinibacter sediminis TaxID=2992237 RepID=UPI00386E572B